MTVDYEQILRDLSEYVATETDLRKQRIVLKMMEGAAYLAAYERAHPPCPRCGKSA